MKVDIYAKIMITIAIIGVIILGYKLISFNYPQKSINSNNVVVKQDGVNVVNLSFDTKSYNYNPNIIRVKSGEKVRIVADPSIPGCYKFFQIPELKLSKYFDGSDNTLEFIAPTPGRYTYTCSMGMGQGTLIVE